MEKIGMPKMGVRGLKYGGQSGIRFRLAEIGSSRAMPQI